MRVGRKGQDQVAMTVRLPEEVHEALRTVAFASDASLNDVVEFDRTEVGGEVLFDFGLLESAVLRPRDRGGRASRVDAAVVPESQPSAS